MSEILDTWTEVRTSDNGISATLYSEWEGGEVIVEDEIWFTQDELSDSREITSLNLSNDSRDAIYSRKTDTDSFTEDTGEELIKKSLNTIQEGDWVIDENPPSWSDDDSQLKVVERLDDVAADEYVIERNMFGNDTTVAMENPSYPSDDTVVLCKFDDQTDSDKPYAYPESRLRLEE